jgi:CheY-like chemotaxis protein
MASHSDGAPRASEIAQTSDATAAGLAPILVVEDSPTSARRLRALLEDVGLVNPIVHIDHGGRAVEWLEDAAQHTRCPALIVLDIELPGRGGMEILRWLREQEPFAAVPVIILTATADRTDMDEAYGLAINSYLVKPVGFDALSDILRHLPLRWALLAPAEHG